MHTHKIAAYREAMIEFDDAEPIWYVLQSN